MILMEKDGRKEFVFDCFISEFQTKGWTEVGKAESVQPPADDNEDIDDSEPTNSENEDASTIDLVENSNTNNDDETAVKDEDVNTEDESTEIVAEPSKETVFACPHCGKTYDKEASLKTHIRRKHNEA